MMELLLFFGGAAFGLMLGSCLALWSLTRYPDYWIKWIMEHSKAYRRRLK